VDLTVNAQMYDIDGFDNAAAVVAQLHSAGRKAVCYIDVGTWENWRSDANSLPAVVKGAYDNFLLLRLRFEPGWGSARG
jgi:hypothetical protein